MKGLKAIQEHGFIEAFSEKPTAFRGGGWTEWYLGDPEYAIDIALDIGLRGARYV